MIRKHIVMKYKCIIFDCDGVLVDSEILSNQVLVDMVTDWGENIDLAYALKNFSGRSLKSCLDYIEQTTGRELSENFIARYREQSYRVFKTHLQPVAGVQGLLPKLTMPYCVASSGPLEKIRRNLTTTNLICYFEGRLFSSYEIKSWKPEPGIFLHAAQQMGFAPEDCLVIEDSIAGVEAAKAGGLGVYAYVPESAEDVFVDTDVKVFSHTGALDKLL